MNSAPLDNKLKNVMILRLQFDKMSSRLNIPLNPKFAKEQATENKKLTSIEVSMF